MFKKKIFAFICCIMLACSLLFSFTVCADTPSYIDSVTPSAAEIVSEVCLYFGVSYQTWDYYILTNNYGTGAYYYVMLVDPASHSDIHILNDYYLQNSIGTPFKIISDTQDTKGILYTQFELVEFPNGDINISYSYGNVTVTNNDTQWGSVDAPYFYASNMNVYVGDDNVNEQLCSMDIFYDSDNSDILFEVTNLTDDTELQFFYGVTDWSNDGPVTVIADDTEYVTYDANTILDYCIANNLDYADFTAYITVYRGIDVVGSLQVSFSDLIDGGEDFYDEKKDYVPFPSLPDYIDDPPEMPTMPDLPDMPDFDPEHPIDSIIDFIVWLGQLLLVPLQYIASLLAWVVATVVYYLVGIFTWIGECFATLVVNIGYALFNLAVDIKGLLYKLFVPRKTFIDGIISNNFPIINDLQHIFSDISVSGSASININLLGSNYGVSALDVIGSGGCAVISSMTTTGYIALCVVAILKSLQSAMGLVGTD